MKTTIIAIAASGLLVAGCGDDPKPEPKTPVGAVAPAEAQPEAPTPVASDAPDEASNVEVDDRIRQMCDLPEARFGFDSARLSAGAQDVLNKLVSCFKDGKGKGKNMIVEGHTDPRGSDDYNDGLGRRRAGAVQTFLAQNGLGQDRIKIESRGEKDATGTDEGGWPKDRRVVILLDE
ncbi:MAG: OmpA family protein [Myxococcota bacterium]